MSGYDTTTYSKIFGWLFVALGVVGFLVTGFDGFTATDGDTLLVFELNPLHNIVHLLVGALLLAGARSPDKARSMTMLVVVVYAIVGVLGFVIPDSANILALNVWDNVLHLVTAAAGAYALMAAGQGHVSGAATA